MFEGVPEQLWWMAYDRLEPIGGDDWRQTATIVSKIHNTVYTKRTKPEDFMPLFRRTLKKAQSPKEMATALSPMGDWLARKKKKAAMEAT